MEVRIEPSWKQILKDEFEKPYFENLVRFVKTEYENHTIFPPASQIFSAFDSTPFDRVKVVIIGQDPYHGRGQANGLCFSVADGIQIPKSLQNIYKELKSDLDIEIPNSGNLERWAKQGVLLLNATLTVREAQAGSHQNKGWEQFTDAVIKKLSSEKQNLVYILWGAYAQSKGEIIDKKSNFVLKSAHPSPLSAHRGFFGSKPFSKTNQFLDTVGKSPIQW